MRPMVRWTLLSALLNLVWEVGQVPLYTLWTERDAKGIALAIAHCTLGDMLVAGGTFLVAAVVTRSWNWSRSRPGMGAAIAIPTGIAYTAFSEWWNVSVVRAWAYAESMPQVFGIGLSPLLQWLVVPLLALALLRAMDKRVVVKGQAVPSDAA